MHTCTHTYAMCVYGHIRPVILRNENAFCIVKLFDKADKIPLISDYCATELFKNTLIKYCMSTNSRF